MKQPEPAMFQAAGIDLACIRERYCHDDQSFIAKAGDRIKSVFLKIGLVQ
jgi:hypothetical protein